RRWRKRVRYLDLKKWRVVGAPVGARPFPTQSSGGVPEPPGAPETNGGGAWRRPPGTKQPAQGTRGGNRGRGAPTPLRLARVAQPERHHPALHAARPCPQRVSSAGASPFARDGAGPGWGVVSGGAVGGGRGPVAVPPRDNGRMRGRWTIVAVMVAVV